MVTFMIIDIKNNIQLRNMLVTYVMICVAFMLNQMLCESKHKYLEIDLYYTVMCSVVSCCSHPPF
jgi:hypothetical protein